MKYYRKEVIYTYYDAMQYTGDNKKEIENFSSGNYGGIRKGQWFVIERSGNVSVWDIVSNTKFQKEYTKVTK
jgi:hypothetical protein